MSDSEVRVLSEITHNEVVFSDGVGVISFELAEQISQQFNPDTTETFAAFQIRYRGSKGVLSIAPKGFKLPRGCHIGLRPSMIKFDGNEDHKSLDILAVSRPITCYLNRQIILILHTLGLSVDPVMRLLDNMLHSIQQAMLTNEAAYDLITRNGGGGGEGVLKACFSVGIPVNAEPFLHGLVRAQCENLMLDLQAKARIHIENGITLIGIVDESQELPYGHIFYQYHTPDGRIVRPGHGTRIIVYRSPSLHPGDVRFLTFYDLPAYDHIYDVAVFSTLGPRPQAIEMSGGDYDGDIYSCITETSLFPPDMYVPPAVYDAPLRPPLMSSTVTIDDIKTFYVDYIKNDNLGRIANAHLVYADLSGDQGASSSECLELAALHSTAVDFAKTGVPADYNGEKHLMPKAYPHFMEKRNKPG